MEKIFFRNSPRASAYEIGFDTGGYARLKVLRANCADTTRYQTRETQLDDRTRRNLKTHLGERLNVAVSRTSYIINEGHLVNKDHDGPFIEVLKRGRDYRRIHGKPFDHAREEAEVGGFEILESILCDPQISIGTTVVSISPRGGEASDYQHNFFDIFVLSDQKGERKVESLRLNSSFSYGDFVDAIAQLDSEHPVVLKKLGGESVDDSDFLGNPVIILPGSPRFRNEEGLKMLLSGSVNCLSEDEFKRIITSCAPLIEAYLGVLQNGSLGEFSLEKVFNAVLNKADFLAGKRKEMIESRISGLILPPAGKEVFFYGRMTVRPVNTGCGFSGSAVAGGVFENLGKTEKPRSVAEYGLGRNDGFSQDSKGDRKFTCPACGFKNIRPYEGFVEQCQNQNCSDPSSVRC